jgi:hypothetical protein
MAPRVQVNNIAAPTLQPVASPVDRFEQSNAGAQLGQLADSLKGLAPELAKYGSTVFQQNKEDDIKAGTAKANEVYAQIVSTGQKIKAGEIAPHESPWFRAAAQEQLGRLHASRFGSTLRTAMEDPNSPLATSTDPADFDKFAEAARQDYIAQNVDGKDGFFSSAFTEGTNKETLALRDQFASQAGTRLQTQVIEGTYIEHQQTIEDGLRAGKSIEQIAQSIYERNTIAYALNPSAGTALSNTMTRAVIDYAKRTENLEVLSLLDHIPGGAKGSTLSKTSFANKLITEATQGIRAARQQRYNLANTEDKNATEEAVEGSIGSLYQAMDAAEAEGKTLTADEVKVFADQVSAVDPSQAERVYRVWQAGKRRTEIDDEVTKNGLYEKAFRGTLTYDEVATAYEADHLTETTARTLRQEIRSNRAKRGAVKALTQSPLVQETKTRLRGLFIDQYGINAPEMRMRAELAVQDLEQAWVNWRRGEGANADDATQSTWLQQQTLGIFGKRADLDLKESTAAVLPKNPSAGPQPVSWEKGLVTKPATLQGLAIHLDNMKKIPHYKLPDAYAELLRRNGIKNPAEAEAFLKKQQSFIPAH